LLHVDRRIKVTGLMDKFCSASLRKMPARDSAGQRNGSEVKNKQMRLQRVPTGVKGKGKGSPFIGY
jgi:hypothetical protein